MEFSDLDPVSSGKKKSWIRIQSSDLNPCLTLLVSWSALAMFARMFVIEASSWRGGWETWQNRRRRPPSSSTISPGTLIGKVSKYLKKYSRGKAWGVYCIKFSTSYYSSHPHFIYFLFSSPNFSFSPLDILPNSLNIIRKMILLPISLFSMYTFFPTAMIFPSPLHNWIFFPNRLDKIPWGGGEIRNFIHLWIF